MEWLSDPQAWIALGTLTALEIVLGIDNIIFISVLVGRLPEHPGRAQERHPGELEPGELLGPAAGLDEDRPAHGEAEAGEEAGGHLPGHGQGHHAHQDDQGPSQGGVDDVPLLRGDGLLQGARAGDRERPGAGPEGFTGARHRPTVPRWGCNRHAALSPERPTRRRSGTPGLPS